MPHIWRIRWLDESADPDHDVHLTARTPEEARDGIIRLLDGQTLTTEVGYEVIAEAYPVLVREVFGGDLEAGLLELKPGDAVTFCTDHGNLIITREDYHS